MVLFKKKRIDDLIINFVTNVTFQCDNVRLCDKNLLGTYADIEI